MRPSPSGACFAKIGWRLMPLLIVSYILNYLDRTNVSFAALTMNDALGLTAEQFGYGSGIFFLGYCFLELPSNLVLYRVGARRWIARIMISWGLVSAAMSLASGPISFYLLRFLLGAAEAGFFPGIAFYLSTWFPSEYRTRIIAWFMVAIPVSSVIGGPLSGLLLHLDGTGGLAGWQWLFIVEGLPVVVCGIERVVAAARSPGGRAPGSRTRIDASSASVWSASGSRRRCGASARARGHARLDAGRRAVRLSRRLVRDRILPAADSSGAAVDEHADRLSDQRLLRLRDSGDDSVGAPRRSRRAEDDAPGVVVRCLCGRLPGAVVFRDSFWMAFAGITVAVIGVNGARAIFWTIPPRFLSGMAAAGGLAFINSIGTSGGQVGPYVMGWLRQYTGSFTIGLLSLSVFLLAAASMAWWLAVRVRREPDVPPDL